MRWGGHDSNSAWVTAPCVAASILAAYCVSPVHSVRGRVPFFFQRKTDVFETPQMRLTP